MDLRPLLNNLQTGRAANDGTGTALRTGGDMVNDNFFRLGVAFDNTQALVGRNLTAAYAAVDQVRASLTAGRLLVNTKADLLALHPGEKTLATVAMDADVNNRGSWYFDPAGAAAWVQYPDRADLLQASLDGLTATVKAGRVYNVLDYMPAAVQVKIQAGGAALNYGDLDQYVTIAVTDLNQSPTGGVLYFPRGTYKLSQRQWITRSNAYIMGDGMGSTLIIFNDGDGSEGFRISHASWSANPTGNYNDVRLQYVGASGFTLSGRGGANGKANRTGLLLGGCGFEGTLQDVEFHGWGLNATVGEDMWDWNIVGCKWTSNGTGQALGAAYPRAMSLRAKYDNSNAIKFLACHWEGNGAGSLDIGGASNAIHVTNCKMEGNGSQGSTWFDDIYIEGGGCVFSNNFVSRDQFQSYWMYVRGKAVIVNGNSLRAPADSRGSPWFKVDPVTDGSVAMQLRIANNTIFGKGDLGQFVFDLRGNVKMHNNDIRLMNGLKAFNVGATGCEIQFNNVIQVGNIGLNSAYMFSLVNGGVFIIDNNTFGGNEYATNGFDPSAFTDANGRLTSRLDFRSRGNVNSSAVAITADGWDTILYGEGYVHTCAIALTTMKRDRLGKKVVLSVGSAGSVKNGSGLYLGAATRSNGWLTLQSVQFSGRVGWQEVSWVPNV